MNWDTELFYLINGQAGRLPWTDWLMYEFSQEGNLLLPIVVCVAYWIWNDWREARIGIPALGALIGLSDVIGAQLKWWIARPRPCHVLLQIQELVGCGGTLSMPSNHAVNSAAAAAFLHMMYPATAWVAWPIVAIIGCSRVYVGAHYVSDVFFGWIVGMILGSVVGFAVAWWVRRDAAPSGSSVPLD